MKSRKLIVKISFGFIVVLILVLAGLIIYQQGFIKKMSDNRQQVPSAAAISESESRPQDDTQNTPMAVGDRGQLAAEIDNLRYQLEASEEELDMARDDLANEQSRPGNNSNLFARSKKMQENQSMRNMERRMLENDIAENYKNIFERLGLPDGKKQDFTTLLVDYEMQKDDVSMDLMDPSLPEGKKNEITQLLEDQDAEFEKQAREMLGAENYEAYNDYRQRDGEWMLVHGPAGGLGLSDEKEQELVDAMYEARREVEAEYGMDQTIVVGIISLNASEEELDRQLEVYDRYIANARAVLSESQAGQFEARINDMKEMQKVSRPSLGGR